ncbi:hypothetical protein BKA70DRAFT_1285359 [Coprinopsis sp. MPI-PUGE-AT-0042]|nr:hypothetical protein BKA70DRAFT_1285359 [Coprinopsis sp. MPI-PUGE-AT-0042]
MVVLYENGIFYYVMILGFTVLNIAAAHVVPDMYKQMFQGIQRVMHPIIACRLVFNAREKGRGLILQEGSTIASSLPVSSLRFGSRSRVQSLSTGLANLDRQAQ